MAKDATTYTHANTNTHAQHVTSDIHYFDMDTHTPSLPQQHNQKNKTTTPLTHINVELLSNYLEGYKDADYIVSGFREGFKLQFDGPELSLNSSNSMSALDRPEVVKEKNISEIKLQRLAGPFHSPPFQNFKISPLDLREKQSSGKFRLLHNLSYPYDERSVNQNIPKDASTVKYATIQDAIKIIQECSPNAHMAKSDIADAFRIIPLHPSQYHLTGFSWEGKYYYDKRLPQGCSSSCKIFESFSSALYWILENNKKVRNTVKVIDDFLFIAKEKGTCQHYLSKLLELAAELGIPIAPQKTVLPCTKLVFLGIELHSIIMLASLPSDKIISYAGDLLKIIEQEKITLRDLKSLIGKLQFATCVILPGRAFLRRMYDLTMGIKKPHYFIRLTKDVKQDILLWHSFLIEYNGKTIIRPPSLSDSECLHLFSDAAKIGFGGTYGSNWIQGKWPQNWASLNITILEIHPVLILAFLFANKIKKFKNNLSLW